MVGESVKQIERLLGLLASFDRFTLSPTIQPHLWI